MFAYYFIVYPARPKRAHEDEKPLRRHAACTAPAPFEKLKHWAILLPEGIACRDMSIDATQTEKYVRFDFTLLDGPEEAHVMENVGQICCMLQ